MPRLPSLRKILRPGGTPAFLVLSVGIGILVGLAAAVLFIGLEVLQGLWHDEDLPLYLPLIVAAGLLGAWAIGRRAPEVVGDGVPDTIEALALHGGRIKTRTAPLKLAATALTVGLGGSAGREGPMVQIGGSIGSSLARHYGLGEDQVRSLVAAGAGAAIGASFNAPIAGMFFAIEVLLRNFAVRHVNAVVLASVAAAVTSRSIVGEDRILRAFPFGLADARELLLYALLGVIAALVGVLFLRLLDGVERVRPARRSAWVAPVIGGLAVGAIGLVDGRVVGSGHEVVASLIRLDPLEDVWWVLVLLAAGKIVTTSVTLGAKGSGGAFMPSLFIGAALGGGFARLVEPVWSFSPLQAGAFAVVGMAAVFAGVARAPLTATLIVFEITGDYGLVLPLMLAASLATFLGELLHADGVYTAALKHRGIVLRRRTEVDVLDAIRVGEVLSDDRPVAPGATIRDVQEQLRRARSHGVAVVENGRLAGVITMSDITRSRAGDEATVAEAMTAQPITVNETAPVSVALERMAALGVGRLPVVADDDPTRFVGMFKREGVVEAYQLGLARATDHEVARQRLSVRAHPGANFFDVTVPAGSIADGRQIREVSWPSGCTVVSVRRGATVELPSGDTVLMADDLLTVYGTDVGRDRLVARLRAGGADGG